MTRKALTHAVARGMGMLGTAAAGLSVTLLALIFLTLIAELVSRNLLGHSLAGSWELAAYMMAAMFCLALTPALLADTHVRVRLLASALPPRALWLAEAAVLVIAISVTAYAARALANLALTSLARGTKSWELAMPMAIPQAAVALGMALFCLGFLGRFLLLMLDPARMPEDA
ncbi:TRAP transporter small permease [Paracoccus sp. (in: a-proteobacteria)]|uniref:TRAP transporter small permease n=1 Tax=Paracoccus sp. TaxID=267 RepID=UPI003A8B92EA